MPTRSQELIQFAEDFSLLIDGLENRVIDQECVAEILRAAFGVERRVLISDVSSSVVLAWTALHAELDLLAKCYGVKWTEAVVDMDLIASLENETASFEDELKLEIPTIACVAKPVSLSATQSTVARQVDVDYASSWPVTLQLSDLNKRIRGVSSYFKDCSFSSRLTADWRRLSTQSEEFMRLVFLDAP
jgi:hypothetical protein